MNRLQQLFIDVYAYLETMMLAPEEVDALEEQERLRRINDANWERERTRMVAQREALIRQEQQELERQMGQQMEGQRLLRERQREQQRLARGYSSKIKRKTKQSPEK